MGVKQGSNGGAIVGETMAPSDCNVRERDRREGSGRVIEGERREDREQRGEAGREMEMEAGREGEGGRRGRQGVGLSKGERGGEW